MKRAHLLCAAASILATVAAAAPASAARLDFTDSFWSGVDGLSTYTRTVAGIGRVTLASTGQGEGAITFNAGTANARCAGTGLACDGDGLGVEGFLGALLGLNDKIDYLFAQEQITVSFADPVDIAGPLLFLNLSRGQIASWETDTGITGSASGAVIDGLGYIAAALDAGLSNVRSIRFFVACRACGMSYALAGIDGVSLAGGGDGDGDGDGGGDVSPIPLPATAALFAAGVAGLGLAGRRRRRRA